MRTLLMLTVLLSLASCASSRREPSSQEGGAPTAIEDGSFPGRAQ